MANPNLFIVRTVYDSVVEIHASGYTEYVAQFLHCLSIDLAQCTGTFTVIVGTELGGNGLDVLSVPFPNRTLLRVLFRVNYIGVNTIAYFKDVVAYTLHQSHLLAAHVAILVVAHVL